MKFLNSAAGCSKILGILYPENSEYAKRSKSVSWRAAVEASTSAEQLALQVYFPYLFPLNGDVQVFSVLFSCLLWYDFVFVC